MDDYWDLLCDEVRQANKEQLWPRIQQVAQEVESPVEVAKQCDGGGRRYCYRESVRRGPRGEAIFLGRLFPDQYLTAKLEA